MRRSTINWGLALVLWTGFAGGTEQPTSELASYTPTADLKGGITSIGSDTLAAAMKLWMRKFMFHHGDIRISMRARGSSLAPPALTQGKAQLGPMSRPMKPEELATFKDAHGYEPTAVQVAFDALTIYVNHSNPIKQLTMEQVDAIFSDQRECGFPEPVHNWGDLGLDGPWQEKPVQLYGRNPSSGTYGFFRKKALCGGQYKPSLTESTGNASLVQRIALRDAGIGYAGIRYGEMRSVRGLLLAKDEDSDFVEPNSANALNGSYPLARPLYIYINKPPGQAVDDVTADFLRMVLSETGQTVVKKSGYIPLPADVATQELAKLD